MVPKLLKRFARRSASTSGGDQTLAGHRPGIERQDRPEPVRNPLPSAWVRMHVWSRDHGKCVLCGSQERVWFDYIVPVWKGGNNERNIRLMCESCNRHSKGASPRRKRWRS
jgi:5-methylcytosine-specific restriction endonuclease McrA